MQEPTVLIAFLILGILICTFAIGYLVCEVRWREGTGFRRRPRHPGDVS